MRLPAGGCRRQRCRSRRATYKRVAEPEKVRAQVRCRVPGRAHVRMSRGRYRESERKFSQDGVFQVNAQEEGFILVGDVQISVSLLSFPNCQSVSGVLIRLKDLCPFYIFSIISTANPVISDIRFTSIPFSFI